MNFQCVWIIEIKNGEDRIPVRTENGCRIAFYNKRQAEKYAKENVKVPYELRFM